MKEKSALETIALEGGTTLTGSVRPVSLRGRERLEITLTDGTVQVFAPSAVQERTSARAAAVKHHPAPATP